MENKKLNDLLQEIKLGDDYEFMKMNEGLDDDIIILDEGVKFFRASNRIKQLVNQLSRKNIKELNPVIERAKRAAMEFAKIEEKYRTGEVSKANAKMRIDNIRRQYTDIMRMLRRKEMTSFFKVAGVATILGGIVASMIFGFQPLRSIGVTLPTWDKVKGSLGLLGAEATRQFNALKRAFESKKPFIKASTTGAV